MWVADGLFGLGVAAAAFSDLLRRRIPNWLNVGILVGGFGARAVVFGPVALLPGLEGAALGLGALLLLFHLRWIGGGDVKLACAMGAWLGPLGVLYAILFGLAGGGLLSLAWTFLGGPALRAEVWANLKASVYSMSAPDAPRRALAHRVPVAVPLAAAAIGVLIAQGGFHA